MAFAATMTTDAGLERPFSIGPVKRMHFTYTAVSGDTTGTITVPGLSQVLFIQLDGGLTYSAAPTFSGNVATIAFTNPAANRFGSGYVLGK
jgi:hypothetical protein